LSLAEHEWGISDTKRHALWGELLEGKIQPELRGRELLEVDLAWVEGRDVLEQHLAAVAVVRALALLRVVDIVLVEVHRACGYEARWNVLASVPFMVKSLCTLLLRVLGGIWPVGL
jgi:predicted LPLAT superfamily acyltransferase